MGILARENILKTGKMWFAGNKVILQADQALCRSINEGDWNRPVEVVCDNRLTKPDSIQRRHSLTAVQFNGLKGLMMASPEQSFITGNSYSVSPTYVDTLNGVFVFSYPEHQTGTFGLQHTNKAWYELESSVNSHTIMATVLGFDKVVDPNGLVLSFNNSVKLFLHLGQLSIYTQERLPNIDHSLSLIGSDIPVLVTAIKNRKSRPSVSVALAQKRLLGDIRHNMELGLSAVVMSPAFKTDDGGPVLRGWHLGIGGLLKGFLPSSLTAGSGYNVYPERLNGQEIDVFPVEINGFSMIVSQKKAALLEFNNHAGERISGIIVEKTELGIAIEFPGFLQGYINRRDMSNSEFDQFRVGDCLEVLNNGVSGEKPRFSP